MTICSAELLQYFLSLPSGKDVPSGFKHSQNNPLPTMHNYSLVPSPKQHALRIIVQKPRRIVMQHKKNSNSRPSNEKLVPHKDIRNSTCLCNTQSLILFANLLCGMVSPLKHNGFHNSSNDRLLVGRSHK